LPGAREHTPFPALLRLKKIRLVEELRIDLSLFEKISDFH
jgi:hypothetical protein